MNIDHNKVADIIREVAEEKIVPRFRQLADHEVRSKSSPGDLVTIADEEAEIELTRLLPSLLPGSVVLGEEAVSSGTTLRDILKQKDTPVWIVDPVDGTGNFAAGNPVFGTMVALIKGGERVASWIYQIPRNRMITGEKGGGVRIDGISFKPPIKPAPDVDFSTLHAFISRKFMPTKIRPYVEEKIKSLSNATTYMCCAWEYVEVMEGNAAFSVYKRIEPWDHMAGVLFLEECEFYSRKWDGSAYLGTDTEGGLINAPSQEIWERVFEAFLKEPLSWR
jgi:fructose-1,6-bisphosphatase/inositol monophosphatase family enzyme